MNPDEVKILEMIEQEVEMALELQQFIESGDISKAKTFIEKLSSETRSSQDPFIQYSLFVAIENGSTEFVQFLVNECRVNFADKIFANDTIYGANQPTHYSGNKWMTPLEIAIRRNKSEIVSYLMSIGVDVDSLAKDESVMRAACLTGSTKTVKILVDHGADVNASDERGDTLLVKSIQDGEICRLLLDSGAEVNRINQKGEAAVDIAVKRNLLSTVKLLVERGADTSCKDKNGCDLLQLASWYGFVEIVDFLIERIFKDIGRHIEALQVLGARFASSDDFTKALSAWSKAIQLSSESGIVRATTVCTPFGNVVEATTLAELDALGQNIDQLYSQCILMICKHFGSKHRAFLAINILIMRRYFEIGSYDRWLKCVIYCFQLMQDFDFNFERTFYDVFDINYGVEACINDILEMTVAPTLDFDLVYELLTAIFKEATKLTRVKKLRDQLDLIVNAALMFFFVKCDNRQMVKFRKLLQSVVKSRLKDSEGLTLFLRAFTFQGWRYLTDGSPNRHVLIGTIDMLLECGADINERDDSGNNILHLLRYEYNELFHSIERAKTLAVKFVDNGIHHDARNCRGDTVTSCLQKLGINVTPVINLMCSAARAIRRFNIVVEGTLPSFLADFVAMH